MTTQMVIFRIGLIIFLVEATIKTVFSVMPSGSRLMELSYSWFFPILVGLLLSGFASLLIYFGAVRP
tara:strand:- start:33543 stop:33743 length:201 start_codon:yes stop_codon:yes gene_type:complete